MPEVNSDGTPKEVPTTEPVTVAPTEAVAPTAPVVEEAAPVVEEAKPEEEAPVADEESAPEAPASEEVVE